MTLLTRAVNIIQDVASIVKLISDIGVSEGESGYDGNGKSFGHTHGNMQGCLMFYGISFSVRVSKISTNAIV
jgi:hypothetical protein